MSDYLLDYISDVVVRQSVQGALNRGEAYDLLIHNISIDLDKIIRQLSTKATEVDCLHLLSKKPEVQHYAEI